MGAALSSAQGRFDALLFRSLREEMEDHLKEFDMKECRRHNKNITETELEQIRKEIRNAYRQRAERRWYFPLVRAQWDAMEAQRRGGDEK